MRRPTISASDKDGPMSYGAASSDGIQAIAAYVARILEGAKQGDLPVKQPTRSS